jgi:hypothetical protein
MTFHADGDTLESVQLATSRHVDMIIYLDFLDYRILGSNVPPFLWLSVIPLVTITLMNISFYFPKFLGMIYSPQKVQYLVY